MLTAEYILRHNYYTIYTSQPSLCYNFRSRSHFIVHCKSMSLFNSCSRITTRFYCDNCRITIDDVSWKQCKHCNLFDLCRRCELLPYDELNDVVRNSHAKTHQDKMIENPITKECMTLVLVAEAERRWDEMIIPKRKAEFERIQKKGTIGYDLELAIVLDELKEKRKELLQQEIPNEESSLSGDIANIYAMVGKYHIPTEKTIKHVLSLDGGGVRGYLSVRVLEQLIRDKHLSSNNDSHVDDAAFNEAQKQFTDQFDYFAGTSTGGLIAFCMATNYSLLKLKSIYETPEIFFRRPYWKQIPYIGDLSDFLSTKYSGKEIHEKIDLIINEVFENNPDGKHLTAKNATLFDLHNLLNHNVHGNASTVSCHQKVLLINAYNTSTSNITVFNTKHKEHHKYFLADVLKSTMAAPVYFPPQIVRMQKKEGETIDDKDPADGDVYIDGGLFANDPELTALWAIRMDWKNSVNYRLMCIGTGCFYPEIPRDTWGGSYAWVMKQGNQGLIIQTLMDATRSLTETIMGNLATFSSIRRMKFNYKFTRSMDLDDLDFPRKFNQEWAALREEPDYKALCYFYDDFIRGGK